MSPRSCELDFAFSLSPLSHLSSPRFIAAEPLLSSVSPPWTAMAMWSVSSPCECHAALNLFSLHSQSSSHMSRKQKAASLSKLSPESIAWLNHSSSPGVAYVSALVLEPSHESEAAKSLLKLSFITISSLTSVVFATDKDSRRLRMLSSPSLSSLLPPLSKTGAPPGLRVHAASRSSILPSLSVRRAVVEDNDDMVPLMDIASVKYPALASLPESCSPEEPFALTRLVSNQDSSNCVLVSKDEDGKTVGFMVLTSEVETSGLLGSFDLHPFDNFLPIETYESQYRQARKRMHARKVNEIREKVKEEAREAKRHDAVTETDDMEHEEEDEGEDNESKEVEKGKAAQEGGQFGGLSEQEILAAAEPLDEEIKAEMLEMFSTATSAPAPAVMARGGGGGGMGGHFGEEDEEEADEDDLINSLRMGSSMVSANKAIESTVFAITMLCTSEDREHEALDLLRAAFEEFPSKDYCLVTLPHDSIEPPLIEKMTRISPLPGAEFPEVLYLFNRNALLDGFEVRLAHPGDVEGVR